MIWSLILVFGSCVVALLPIIYIRQILARRISAAIVGVLGTLVAGAAIGAAQTPAALLAIPVVLLHMLNAMRLVENRQKYEDFVEYVSRLGFGLWGGCFLRRSFSLLLYSPKILLPVRWDRLLLVRRYVH